MPIAAPHPRQEERLKALDSYEILDTDPEKDFDDIVQLAAALCGTTISVINLIDADRQWFKAETGLGVRETPIETSLCAHAILEADFLEVADTRLDPRMADNPLCTGDPGLRFYAGALLKTEDGLPLGTLCVLNPAPMVLTPLQRDTLRVLARQIMAQLEMRKALRHAALLRQEVDHRVKNSLTQLASLVRVTDRRATSDETHRALSTLTSRIEAVATLHEELYRTDAGPVIDLASYVENLGIHFGRIAPPNVSVHIDARPIRVSSGQAVATGTLVNEFVANAFKHAFPDNRTGTIRIAVTSGPEAGEVRLTCTDDGVGLPADPDAARGGLGMQIAAVISAELRGTLDVESGPGGTCVSLGFRSHAVPFQLDRRPQRHLS
jgi:two-component sensor histidine kinase